MSKKILTVKRRVDRVQPYSLNWSREVLINDFVFYLPSYRVVASSVDDLFAKYKEKVINKKITKLLSNTSIGFDEFVREGKKNIKEDSMTVVYEDPSLTGIEFTETVSYQILNLEHYSKLPKEGNLKSLSITDKNIQDGVSNYFYTRYFMPTWSTAYKYNQSTHSKVVGPVFSNLTYIPTHIKGLISKASMENKLDTSNNSPLNLPKYLNQDKKEYLSRYTLTHFVNENYLLGSNKILNFGDTYNTIYIQTTKLLPEMELVISGLYKNTFTECKIKLKSKGFIKLSLPFSKIYNIEKTSYNIHSFEDAAEILIQVSNSLPLTGFIKEKRLVRDIEYLKDINRIVLYNSDTTIENVFSLGTRRYENIFIDKNDKVVCTSGDGIVYTGKLDANLAMNVPKDVSSNNNVFIELCNLDVLNYKLEVYMKKYVLTTNTQSFCISVTDSKGDVLYLDKNLNLVQSDEKIFLKLSEVFQDVVSINLEMEEDLEYVVVKIEDWDNRYPVTNVIVQPILKLIPILQLPSDKKEPLYLVNDRIAYIHKSENSFNHISMLG